MTMMLLPGQHDSVDQGNGQGEVCFDDSVAASSFAVGVWMDAFRVKSMHQASKDSGP
jgi:hypothetical protein